MDDITRYLFEEMIQSAPGGVAKVAMDDTLTILFATETFYSTVRTVTDDKTPSMLLRLVYSADVIHVTQQIASQKNRKDNMLSFNFRILQQDGSFKWIMLSGKRMQEIYQNGTKQVPVFACVASDITDIMQQYKKLEQSVEYNRVITDLSKDLYFEYDIASDTLSFSEIFRETFGKDAVIPGFRKKLEKTKLIHAEELPAIIKIFNSMMSGRKLARFEFRMLSKNRTPSWYICYASIIIGENRTPSKLVGKLALMNSIEKLEEEAVYIPVMDALTNVCNKESTEIMIKEAINKQSQNSLSALLLVDIRNYKSINEIRKSIQGEDILTSIASILKKNVRTSDVIGRIGLGEFAVFLKDIPTENLAFDKAEKLWSELEALHSYPHTKNGLVVSIGVTLQRGKQEYEIMMAHANAALVMAKKVPASSFEVFSGNMSN
jgi:diguanylate cyclase (GGDEF)-like protein